MKKWTVCSGFVGLALLLLPQQGQALSFTVDSATVNVSDTFSINLNVVNPDAIEIISWQFDLTYDPTLLQANAVTEGPFLSSSGTTFFTPGIIDNTTGLISLVSASFVDLFPPSGSGVLASIDFTALSPGLSPLTPSNVFLNFESGGFTVTPGSVCVTGGSTCGVSAVPEPSALLLLGLGLGIFLFAQQRQIFGKRSR